MERIKLVAYFSATGTTAEKARQLAAAADADLYEIRPAEPYTADDLNWKRPLSRCNKEWLKKTRPALADAAAPIADYDVIFIAFPIWYYTAPLIINTFLESYDFRGKMVVLFATSGGSDMKRTVKSLFPSAPRATFVQGLMLNGEVPSDRLADFAERF